MKILLNYVRSFFGEKSQEISETDLYSGRAMMLILSQIRSSDQSALMPPKSEELKEDEHALWKYVKSALWRAGFEVKDRPFQKVLDRNQLVISKLYVDVIHRFFGSKEEGAVKVQRVDLNHLHHLSSIKDAKSLFEKMIISLSQTLDLPNTKVLCFFAEHSEGFKRLLTKGQRTDEPKFSKSGVVLDRRRQPDGVMLTQMGKYLSIFSSFFEEFIQTWIPNIEDMLLISETLYHGLLSSSEQIVGYTLRAIHSLVLQYMNIDSHNLAKKFRAFFCEKGRLMTIKEDQKQVTVDDNIFCVFLSGSDRVFRIVSGKLSHRKQHNANLSNRFSKRRQRVLRLPLEMRIFTVVHWVFREGLATPRRNL